MEKPSGFIEPSLQDERLPLTIDSISRLKDEISTSSRKEIVELANSLGIYIALNLKHDQAQEALRKVDEMTIESLRNTLENGGVILMRHGEQRSSGAKDLRGADLKIKMMQPFSNRTDPLTNKSICELGPTAFVLDYLVRQSNQYLTVFSSVNARALQAAAVISKTAGSKLSLDGKLNCVNYPVQLTEEQKEFLYSSQGLLPWREEAVDLICGKGKFNQITADVKELIDKGREGENVVLMITHSQQVSAAATYLGINNGRLKEYGMIVAPREGQPNLFESGVFSLS